MTTTHAAPTVTRDDAVRRARALNRFTLGYNFAEALVALVAGLAAGSIGLIGFGLDSVVEVSASVALAWRLAKERRGGCMQSDDRVATKAIAVSFAVLALYITVEGVRRLIEGEQPETSMVGVVLAATSLIVMPVLARAKARLAPALGSRAQEAEAAQTALCAQMSAIVLAGLLLHVLFGWWWADPTAALGLGALAATEAVRTWRAESLADTCCA